jgi:hypothetical protein
VAETSSSYECFAPGAVISALHSLACELQPDFADRERYVIRYFDETDSFDDQLSAHLQQHQKRTRTSEINRHRIRTLHPLKVGHLSFVRTVVT